MKEELVQRLMDTCGGCGAETEWGKGFDDGVDASIDVVEDYFNRCKIDEPQAEKVEAHLAEHWNEDIGDVLWWDFPVEEPPYCGTPLDEHFPNYKTHFTTIDMPNEIEKPKRWVVKFKQQNKQFYFIGWIHMYSTQPIGYARKEADNVIKFTDKKKAEAVATLIEGSVEEV
jgi:hypothetical protein